MNSLQLSVAQEEISSDTRHLALWRYENVALAAYVASMCDAKNLRTVLGDKSCAKRPLVNKEKGGGGGEVY